MEPGTVVAGRYRVVRHLGSGAMASVHLAEDPVLGRQVAVKSVQAAPESELGRRIRREAQLGAGLTHPHLVTVFDTSVVGDTIVIVMEFVPGETLDAALARGPLEPARAVAVLRAVAEALDHIHARGVVHRDVKPANVLLSERGTVKLADLGVATSDEATRITRTGGVLGTAAYMAPEQFDPGPVTAAADIHALATVAFQALTGRRAYTGATFWEVMARVREGDPPDARTIRPELPAPVAAALRRGMARDPDDRPITAAALVDDLEAGLRPTAAAEPQPTVAMDPLPEPPEPSQPAPPPPDAQSADDVPPAPKPDAEEARGMPPAPKSDAEEARGVTPRPEPEARSVRAVPPSLKPNAERVRGVPPTPEPEARPVRAAASNAPGGGRDGSGGSGAAPASPARPVERRKSRGAAIGAGVAALVVAVVVVLALTSGGGDEPEERAEGTGSTTARTTSTARSTTPAATGTPAPADDTPAPAPAENAAPAAADASTPARAVRAFYERAADGDLDGAWALAGPGVRAQLGPRATFDGTFRTLRAIRFSRLSTVDPTPPDATVRLSTVATHTDRTDRCTGSARTTQGADGTWKVERLDVAC